MALAQESTPEPTPEATVETTAEAPSVGDVTVNVTAPAPTEFPEFDPSAFIAMAIAFLMYLGGLAGAAQAAIAKLEPINQQIDKALNLGNDGKLVRLNIERFFAGLISMFSVGGVATVRGILTPLLDLSPFHVPDIVLGAGAAMLLMAGQDKIFDWLGGAKIGQEALHELNPQQQLELERARARRDSPTGM